MQSFRALEVEQGDAGYTTRLVERTDADLPDGDVTVDVRWSDVNYKDGLIISGRFDLVRRFPMTAGIDLVGTVAESTVADLPTGLLVTVNGQGLSTDHPGGYAERARVPHGWVTPVPEPIDDLSAAAIGTAGYTAALAVRALQEHHVEPGGGPVLVTGAAGGAGSVAVMLLGALGYEVVASTGRREQEEKSLLRLGATTVVDRLDLLEAGQLGRAKWAGAVDTLGSRALATVLSETRYGGTVAAMGMAMGVDLPAFVVPFISRGVTLAGIDSVYAPAAARRSAWALLAERLDLAVLREITEIVPLAEAPERGNTVLAGQVRGRLVVDVRA